MELSGASCLVHTLMYRVGDMPSFHQNKAQKIYIQDPPRPLFVSSIQDGLHLCFSGKTVISVVLSGFCESFY